MPSSGGCSHSAGHDESTVILFLDMGEIRLDHVTKEFEGGTGTLNDEVYQFGLMLMGQLRDDEIGRRAPNTSTPKSLGSTNSRPEV